MLSCFSDGNVFVEFVLTLVLQRTTTTRKWIFTSKTLKTIAVYKVFNVIMTMSATPLSDVFIN